MSKKITVKIIYTLAVLSGMLTLAIGFYPTVSDAWNRYVSSRLISEYISSSPDAVDYTKESEAADRYNKELFEEGRNNIAKYTIRLSGKEAGSDTERSGEVKNPDEYYESMVSIWDDGMMGYIEIPSIDVSLPIYHYASEEILSKGVGHLYGSSLPVGGENTHSALTGHCGLIEAKIFTDLENVKIGEMFIIHVFDRTLNYEVDKIKEVLPNEMKDLGIEKGKDLVTLITCTPYGVNTHRLLVRGHRVADDKEPVIEDTPAHQLQQVIKFPITIFAFSGLVLLFGIVLIIRIWKK